MGSDIGANDHRPRDQGLGNGEQGTVNRELGPGTRLGAQGTGIFTLDLFTIFTLTIAKILSGKNVRPWVSIDFK